MRHFILPDERVLDLAQLHRDPHIWVESVLMVSPGFMNGSSDWQMNSLAAIWTSVEPDAPSQYATVYELDDGRRYVRSALGSSLDSLPPPKLIADFRNHRAAV